MPVGRFLLCLHSHMPYVLSHGKSPHGTDWINESTAECYLPLLHALDRLHREGIKPRWTVNMTPILAEQLEDPSFKDGFEDYCQQKIDFAISDAKNFERQGPLWMQGLACFWQRQYTRALVQFKHQWGRSVIEGFRFFQDQGCIEVITSGATHGYQPLLGTDESCVAQVRLGKEVYRKHFGQDPRGIWLPECAYRPRYDWKSPVGQNEVAWPRMSTDEILKQEGFEYFFIDSHMIRGGHPLGTYAANFPQLAELFARSSRYFTPPTEYRSEYEHYLLPTGETVFARDPETTVKVWSGEAGYPGDPQYLEFHKQLYPGRLRYWRISENKADLGQKQPYDPYAAFESIQNHAADMVNVLKGTLARYRGQADRVGTLTAMYDTELFGHWWWEGPEFLYELARNLHHDGEIPMVSGGDVLDAEPARHMITMPEGSWGEGGYHYIWLNDDNAWTWEKLYPVERKLRQMARDYADGPAREVVVQAAREMLLAEASDWQFLISTFSARDYAEIRFQDHIDRFDRLAAIADRIHLGGSMTAEEVAFLRDCQLKDAPFQDLDLSLWRPIAGAAG
ncbi:MAG TPA: 1,4-alpha-glucan branching protein domain-containing protein [Fimbriimonas sp.]